MPRVLCQATGRIKGYKSF